jgi:hypothetical protein
LRTHAQRTLDRLKGMSPSDDAGASFNDGDPDGATDAEDSAGSSSSDGGAG